MINTKTRCFQKNWFVTIKSAEMIFSQRRFFFFVAFFFCFLVRVVTIILKMLGHCDFQQTSLYQKVIHGVGDIN